MTPIEYAAPRDLAAAFSELRPVVASSTVAGGAKFIAGGTNIIDLMKENVMRPAKLVDINGLGLDAIEPTASGGLMLGALARNADTAYHSRVRSQYPLLTAAILAGASPQIRNMATNGGNLLQRTRCHYFYDLCTPCNKRTPGVGCSAIGGLTRQHAILGASEHCIATHPSDMCVALRALDARIHVRSAEQSQVIDIEDFHRLPGEHPDQDSNLAPDELITHIELPEATQFIRHSTYLKLRERASYAFALVSVAVALNLADDGTVIEARVALGGVAHKPWRSREAEALLIGKVATAENFTKVAEALLRDARGQGANDFKIPMAHRAIIRALEVATAGTVPNTGEEAQV